MPVESGLCAVACVIPSVCATSTFNSLGGFVWKLPPKVGTDSVMVRGWEPWYGTLGTKSDVPIGDDKDPRKGSPEFVPGMLPAAESGQLAM